MSSAANSEGDQASEVVPAIRHVVPWRVVTVEALADHRLRVEFVDGTAGEVDMDAFLAAPRVAGTVFESLRESAFLAQAAVIMGAVQWPNGADLAPDAMYDAIREHGVWVLA